MWLHFIALQLNYVVILHELDQTLVCEGIGSIRLGYMQWRNYMYIYTEANEAVASVEIRLMGVWLK